MSIEQQKQKKILPKIESEKQIIRQMDIRALYKVGDVKAKYLSNLGIRTVYDLLHHYPFRYEDRRALRRIKDITRGEKVCTSGQIITFEKRLLKKNKTIIKIKIQDDSSMAELVIFNNPFLYSQLRVGRVVFAYGTAEEEYGLIKMNSPELEFDQRKLKTGMIYPVYPLTRGITNDEMIRWQKESLQILSQSMEEDYINEQYREEYKLCSLYPALKNIHFPTNEASLKIARYRLVFDEFFLLNIGLSTIKNKVDRENGIAFEEKKEVHDLKQKLPFLLTEAQQTVLDEILQDMKSEKPMQRLIQGDVGSGKTIIAFLSIYNIFLNGYQSVLMAPTEILAKQHFHSAIALFESMDVKIRLLIGSTPRKEKEAIYRELQEGTCDLLIGTHAVLEDKVCFRNLGLLITDEQHRFGVRQRAKIIERSDRTPDMLVMTATPIPRTMAFIIHGDLDISVIDQLPMGRKPIITRSVSKTAAEKIYAFAAEEIQKGRQVYVVCPLIEESENLDIQAATEHYQSLKNGLLKDYTVALLHGRQKAKEKQGIMDAFKDGKIQVLVSTTVIEVGINVPNASVMIIEDAQRFGLSQLHQLRGRVGRGKYQSHCILVYEGKSSATKERMKIMCQSNDGFEISEKDLELRGPGEFLGTRQHGILHFKLADIMKHKEVIRLSRTLAKKVLDKDPVLSQSEHHAIAEEVKARFNQAEPVRIN